MRVLVVDDSAFMRRAITNMLESDSSIEVVDTARNGREGVEKVKSLKPDVITLDIEMPDMDGLTALRHIMSECPTPVVMCSSLTSEGSHATLRALHLGAIDFVSKDASQVSLKIMDLQDDLIAKVKTAARSRIRKARKSSVTPAVVDQVPTLDPRRIDLVVIGSSTGGPPVVESLLKSVPADFCAPIVIAQHMPVLFTKSLAERLDERCAVSVFHAENRMMLVPGSAYILPGGQHGRVVRRLDRKLSLNVSEKPVEAVYKPSVNELMRSAAECCKDRALGIMLTGMGDDGCVGAERLVSAGGTLIAQNEETCVVYGMPKAVTQAGYASANLSPQRMALLLRPLRGLSRAG